MLDANDFSNRLLSSLGGQRFSLRTDHDGGDGLRRAKLQSGSQRFPTGAADPPAALFQNQKNTHSTRASVFSFSTSAAAASFGEPCRICVDFCFFGAAICSRTTTGAASAPRSASVHRTQFFGFRRLMPISVA